MPKSPPRTRLRLKLLAELPELCAAAAAADDVARRAHKRRDAAIIRAVRAGCSYSQIREHCDLSPARLTEIVRKADS